MSLSVEAVDDINLPDYDYDADDDVNVSTRNVAAIGAIDIALLPSRNCRALPLLLHHLPPIRQSPFLPPTCPRVQRAATMTWSFFPRETYVVIMKFEQGVASRPRGPATPARTVSY